MKTRVFRSSKKNFSNHITSLLIAKYRFLSRALRLSPLALVGLINLVSANNVTAIENEESLPDWYQIEYIIFKHLDSDLDTLIYENHSPKTFNSNQHTYLVNSFTPLVANQKSRLENEEMRLNQALTKLSNSIAVEVLDVGAWSQEIDNDSSLPPVPVRVEIEESRINNQAQYTHELLGEVTIKRSRYLHAKFDLALNTKSELVYENTVDWFLDPMPYPISWIIQPLQVESPLLWKKGVNDYTLSAVKVEESRRIKDEEIHYIDHPLLGIIVTIKKIEHPDADLDNV